MFNRQEQVALLFLSGALLIGSAASLYDHYCPASLEDFQVVGSASRRLGGTPLPHEGDSARQADEAPEVEEQTVDAVDGEAKADGDDGSASRTGRVDVNTASVTELQELPRIGPKTAERIVQYRRDNGPFGTLDELRRIPGIGPRTVERLRARAIVGSPPAEGH